VLDQQQITLAMIEAGVRVLAAHHTLQSREQLVREIFLQMLAAKPPTVRSRSPTLGHFIERVPALSAEEARRAEAICSAVPGFTDKRHYAFFKHLFASGPIEKLLILGVYAGRDVAFALDAARELGRPLHVVGVDKFSDEYCDDWPEQSRALNWQQAGFGQAPSLESAKANLERLGFADDAILRKQRDEEFFGSCCERFDAIYLDTSHDYATVVRQIRQAAGLLTEDGILCGDDYSDQGTWGVKRAVTELIPGHLVFANWIWIGARDQIKV
jgi:Methyltransferase domain